MNAGLDPTLQALTTGNPEQFLSQASTITELDQSSGDKVSTLTGRENQDQRDRQTADQQVAAVQALQAQMNAKKQAIDAKIDQVNSAAMKQAMAIFTQTGQYPDISIPTANTVGAQALAGGAVPARRSVRLGGGGPGRIRLLGAGGLGLRPGRHLASALHRGPVELRRAYLAGRPGARRSGVLLPRHFARGDLPG